MYRAGLAHVEGEAELDELLGTDPLRGEQHPCSTLPSHHGGKEDAARRLGRHAELGEGHAQTGGAVHQHEVAVGEHREAEADRDPVDRGQEGDRNVAEAVEEALEPPVRALDLGAGGDGCHLGQVGARREGTLAAGQHHGGDGLVRVGGTQRGGQLEVHGGVERVAHLGPVEGEDADARRGVLGLDAAHEGSATRSRRLWPAGR